MKSLFLVLVILACIFCGILFYKMNQGDAINGAIFAIGLTGIALSIVREKREEPKNENNEH